VVYALYLLTRFKDKGNAASAADKEQTMKE
jgi:hypothetical protein